MTDAEMEALLRSVEISHHERGWDELPATLYSVIRDGDRVNLNGLELIDPQRHPREEIASLARSMERPWAAAVMRKHFRAASVAHLLVFEGWARDFAPGEEPDRSLADIPGSRKMRLVTGVYGEEQMTLMRIRGEEPQPLRDVHTGHMVESLRRIHDAERRAFE